MSPVDFLNLFVRPPGDLLYFVTIIAVLLASLFMALGQQLRRPDDTAAKRYTIALVGSVAAWGMLMIGALLALSTNNNAVDVLPPLERFASVVMIEVLLWAFLTSNQRDWGRMPTLVLAGVIVTTFVAYLFTAQQWASLVGDIDFNISVLGATWTFVAAGVTIVGMLLLLTNFTFVVDAPLKLVYFLILTIGYIGTLIQIVQGNIIGDYAGPIRLVFVASLAIVPAVVYRAVINALENEIIDTTEYITEQIQTQNTQPQIPTTPIDPVDSVSKQPPSPIERESVQLLRVMGLMLQDATAANMPRQIVEAVAHTMKVDVVALLRLQDANYADIEVAYDKAMKRHLDGLAINLNNQPTLVSCIERQSQRNLHPDHNPEELQDLYARFDIDQTGPVYFQPLLHDQDLVAVLMVALPYANYSLLSAEEDLLKGVGVIAGSLLALSDAANDAQLLAEERTIQAMVQGVSPDDFGDTELVAARQELQASLELSREQIAQLSKQVMQLKLQLDEERSRAISQYIDDEEVLSISQQMQSLTDTQRLLVEERETISERLQDAETMMRGVLAEDDDVLLQQLVDDLQREKAELLLERDRLQKNLDEMRAADRVFMPQEFQAILENMMEERSQLEVERNQLSDKLTDVQGQLKTLGMEEGAAGLRQLVAQLIEQRNGLQQRVNTLTYEVERLVRERTEVQDRIDQEEERDARIRSLELQLQNIAGDREVAIKQRDKLRTEHDELLKKIDVIKEHRTRLLAQSSAYEMELQEAHQQEAALLQQIEQLANERSDLFQQRDRLLAQQQAIETERDQLLARIEGDRDRIQELGTTGVGSLTTMIDDLTVERNNLQHELHQTRTTLASVQNELEAMQVRLSENGASSTLDYQPENPDLLISLVEDLRTPMTSIIGYVDLLLGESPGILGEAQRKFLRRVSTNVDRLALMLDDLIKVTELDTGKFTLEPTLVNVTDIIVDTITESSNQFREKGLVINLNLEDTAPSVYGDPDAISQVIGQLLTNAYLVSPPSAEILIEAHAHQLKDSDNLEKDYLYVSITDKGGGIDAEDVARVFARKYKAENPLIRGLGDTGVGLAVARALVETHGGRMGLETVEGVGSTFSFILPVNQENDLEGQK